VKWENGYIMTDDPSGKENDDNHNLNLIKTKQTISDFLK
jgi:hypothetical protein